MRHTIAQRDIQPWIPLQQQVIAFAIVARSGFNAQTIGRHRNVAANLGLHACSSQRGREPRRRLIPLGTAEVSSQRRPFQVRMDIGIDRLQVGKGKVRFQGWYSRRVAGVVSRIRRQPRSKHSRLYRVHSSMQHCFGGYIHRRAEYIRREDIVGLYLHRGMPKCSRQHTHHIQGQTIGLYLRIEPSDLFTRGLRIRNLQPKSCVGQLH